MVMLTESWLNENSVCDVSNFGFYRQNRKLNRKNARRDSGGIIVYESDKISPHVTLIKTESDCILWLKIDSCLFEFEHDLFLCVCYNIPSGSGREAMVQRNFYDMLSDDVAYFSNVYDDKYNFLSE